jgi:hybrid cluster-associated redox disulfide protein
MSKPRVDDPDLPLAELMAAWPATIQVFLRHRMLCVGCLVAPFHTIMDACAEYGLDEAEFAAELRAATGAK